MLADVVVDTNVLLHADDPRQPYRFESQGLLDDLLAGKTLLCIDEGFDIDESKNRSLIGGEYFERLTITHAATAVLAELFATGQVRLVSRSVQQRVKKGIEQCVRNKRDRTFIAVAHNSEGKVLCSHDFEDLQRAKRKLLRARTGVEVLGAAEVRALV